MKLRYLIFTVLILNIAYSHSQGVKKNFDNSGKLSNFQVFRLDTVLIKCDTAYVLNKMTFNLYHSVYSDFKNNNKTFNDLLKTYENLVSIQDENIQRLNRDYSRILSKFDSLASNSAQISTTTRNSLSVLNDSISNTIRSLAETKAIIHDARKDIVSGQKRNIKNQIYWGIGGFAVGLITTSLIFLMAR